MAKKKGAAVGATTSNGEDHKGSAPLIICRNK